MRRSDHNLVLDVVIFPGGIGANGPGSDAWMGPHISYLETLDLSGGGGFKWALTFCTGSEVLTRMDILDKRKVKTD